MGDHAPTRPTLRYYGGKWRLADWIIGHLPPHEVYVEPFAGAASVLMRKPRCRIEVINDLDGQVVNLFRVLRDQPAELERLLLLTPYARAEREAAGEPSDDPIEQARRTVVRSFMSHGRGGQTRSKVTGFRRFSTAGGAHNQRGHSPATDWAGWPEQIDRFAHRLAGVVIEQRPAIEVFDAYDAPGVLTYLDPPYPHDTRGAWFRYDHELTDEGHLELLRRVREARGMVVLSGYRCDLYDEALAGLVRVERAALADGNTGTRGRTEVLWFNDAAQSAMHQQRLELCQ